MPIAIIDICSGEYPQLAGPDGGALHGLLPVCLRRLDGEKQHPRGEIQVGPLLRAQGQGRPGTSR